MQIIAEIGHHHLGDMNLAMHLIDLAKENGADMAKFQLFDTIKIYENKPINPEVQRAELSFGQAKMLFDYGEKISIEVFFSVFDTERVKWCEDIGVKTYKIAARSAWDTDLLLAVKNTGKEIIQSVSYTGQWKPGLQISEADILLCNTNYPAKVDWLPDRFGFGKEYQGFSDHTIGMEVAKIVIARGGIIEKHFALDHKTGIDAKWSMNASELLELRRWANIS